VFRHADAALLRAKHAGRDRIELADTPLAQLAPLPDAPAPAPGAPGGNGHGGITS
jgi:hypothetical protein